MGQQSREDDKTPSQYKNKYSVPGDKSEKWKRKKRIFVELQFVCSKRFIYFVSDLWYARLSILFVYIVFLDIFRLWNVFFFCVARTLLWVRLLGQEFCTNCAETKATNGKTTFCKTNRVFISVQFLFHFHDFRRELNVCECTSMRYWLAHDT